MFIQLFMVLGNVALGLFIHQYRYINYRILKSQMCKYALILIAKHLKSYKDQIPSGGLML